MDRRILFGIQELLSTRQFLWAAKVLAPGTFSKLPFQSTNPPSLPEWFLGQFCSTSCLLRHNDQQNRLQWHLDPSSAVSLRTGSVGRSQLWVGCFGWVAVVVGLDTDKQLVNGGEVNNEQSSNPKGCKVFDSDSL